MSAGRQFVVGAVAYDPKVVTIWEGIRDHFRGARVECDYVLFSNYEAQARALLDGRINAAWNTNLAYAQVHAATKGTCKVLAMRDTDVGFTSLLVGGKGALGTAADLKGRTLALGSADSMQAAILPLHFLRREGLRAGEDFSVLHFDTDVGKHGDTGRSEVEAVTAVLDGQADAAAVGSANWVRLATSGEVPPDRLEAFWTSPPYCHCNFTALASLDPEVGEAWTARLLEMQWSNPEHRRILEMEGLRRWIRPDLDGYAAVFDALGETQ